MLIAGFNLYTSTLFKSIQRILHSKIVLVFSFFLVFLAAWSMLPYNLVVFPRKKKVHSLYFIPPDESAIRLVVIDTCHWNISHVGVFSIQLFVLKLNMFLLKVTDKSNYFKIEKYYNYTYNKSEHFLKIKKTI